jgi:hypothetical protein
MTASCQRVGALVTKMQDAFLNDPDLTLTLPKARLRFRTSVDVCKAILDCLVDARVLTQTRESAYRRFAPRTDARAA